MSRSQVNRRKRQPRDAVRRAAFALVGLFLVFNLASFVYTLVTEEYNGDFYGVPVGLSSGVQCVLFIASSLPFILLWRFFLRVEKRPPSLQISVPLPFLKVFVPLLLVIQAYLTLQYQVGIIGQPAYQIDGPMKLLALLVNRFQPFYIGTFFLLVLPRRSWLELLTIALLVWIGLLRAGLGAFLYVGLALLLKYYGAIVAFARRRWFAILLGICAMPSIVFNLYTLRDSLREGDAFVDYSVATLVTGFFLGRISSLSNTMVVVENTQYFSEAASMLDAFYFQKQMIGGVLGPVFMPALTPQNLLININGGDIENYSYMTGLVGELQIAAHQALLAALLNLASVCIVAYLTIRLARAFRFPESGAFGMMLLLYPTMSGVASEYSAVLYFFVLLAVSLGAVHALDRLLRKKRRRRVRPDLAFNKQQQLPLLGV